MPVTPFRKSLNQTKQSETLQTFPRKFGRPRYTEDKGRTNVPSHSQPQAAHVAIRNQQTQIVQPADPKYCETNPPANDPINISNTNPPLHFPNACRRLNISDVERKSNPISALRRPIPTPCKQHYYFGHRIRPRVRPFGRVSEGHQRG
jgi:hypothetical protein